MSDGFELDVLRGTWDGGDALGLEAAFVNRRGDHADAPVSMRRSKATEFETMCGRQAPA